MFDTSGDSIGDLRVDIMSLKAEIEGYYRDVPFPEDDLHHTPEDQLLSAFIILNESSVIDAPIELTATKGGWLFDFVARRISRGEFESYTCCLCAQTLNPEEVRSEYWSDPNGWDGRVMTCPSGHLIARTIEVIT